MSDGLDVIVVDDDPGICDVISELIEKHQGRVVDSYDPREEQTTTRKTRGFTLQHSRGVKTRSTWPVSMGSVIRRH